MEPNLFLERQEKYFISSCFYAHFWLENVESGLRQPRLSSCSVALYLISLKSYPTC